MKELTKVRFLNAETVAAIRSNRTLQTYLQYVFAISEQTLLNWLNRKSIKICHPDALDVIRMETGIVEVFESEFVN